MASSPEGVGGGGVEVGVSDGVGVSVGNRVAVGVGVSGIVVDVSVGGGEVAEGGTGVCVGKAEGEATAGDSTRGVGVAAQPATNHSAMRVASKCAIRRRRTGEKPGCSISA